MKKNIAVVVIALVVLAFAAAWWFTNRKHDIVRIALNPEGVQLASGDVDGKVILWDLATRKRLKLLRSPNSGALLRGREAAVGALAFSPDGKSIAIGDQRGVELVRLTYKHAKAYPRQRGVNAIAIGQSGELAIYEQWSDTIDLVRLDGSESIDSLTVPDFVVEDMRFCQDGRTLVSAQRGGTIILWAVDSWSQIAGFQTESEAAFPRIQCDGDVLIVGNGNVIQAWGFEEGRQRHIIRSTVPDSLRALAVSRDGDLVAGAFFNHTEVVVWNLEEGHVVARIPVNTKVRDVTFLPEGTIVTAGEMGIEIWDIEANSRLHRMK